MAQKRSQLKGVIFDLYNTLIEIRTEEGATDVWQRMALFFSYQGVEVSSGALADDFRDLVQRQQTDTAEEHPEINMARLFADMLARHGAHDEALGAHMALLFRALTMRSIQLFPDTLPSLQQLHGKLKLGLVSDAQTAWLVPEMRRVGIDGFFEVRIVSSDYGIRKPDPRLFHKCLEAMQLRPEEVVMVGDSAYRDVGGAQASGIRGCLLTRHAPFEAQDALVKPDLIFQSLVEFVRWTQEVSAPSVGAGRQ